MSENITPLFNKEEIIARVVKLRSEKLAAGEVSRHAEMNLAMVICGCALYSAKQFDGSDYGEHPITVGMRGTRSTTKRVIGLLHDVVEDSDWTLEDLKKCGFSQRVIDGVDGVTKRNGEGYFDFVERTAMNADSVDVKLNDLEHNMSAFRNTRLMVDRDVRRMNKYMIAKEYLVAIKKEDIAVGTTVAAFVKTRPEFSDASDLLIKESRHP